jgi:SagB-type dehydrogenase family enzyme
MKFFRICFLCFAAMVFVANPAKVFAQEKQSLAAIQLPQADFSSKVSLMQALQKRKSSREFKTTELPLQVMSNLLWAACGINRPESGLRTAPSAKNAQEIDIYVAMKSGLYIYNAKTQALDPFLAQDIRSSVGIQGFVKDAPLSLIFVADFGRMDGSEEDKIHYSRIDTGYISQNVYLFCAAENLATVVLGWIDQEALAKAMNLKPSQHIILTQPVGYPK